MSNSSATIILFPPGRLVAGSMTEPQTTDQEGRPLLIKSGPNVGKPRVDYFFAVAIPKGAEPHWNQTAWGAELYRRGMADFPQGQWQLPTFAWKVTDGDSAVPNTKGRAPNSREGYPRHWVVAFSSGFAPKTFQMDGTMARTLDPAAIKLGNWVQVQGSVAGNDTTSKPGIFINHNMVALVGYDPAGEISVGPDPQSVGFGQAPLPPGVSTVPTAGIGAGALPPLPGAVAAPPLPGAVPPIPVPATAPPAPPAPPLAQTWPPQGWTAHPSAPGFYYQGNEVLSEADLRARNVTTPVAPPAVAPPPPIPTVPDPSILAPPAPVQHIMLTGQNYDAMRAKGWTDEQMIAAGHMAA
jgi:hypothetical protein